MIVMKYKRCSVRLYDHLLGKGFMFYVICIYLCLLVSILENGHCGQVFGVNRTKGMHFTSGPESVGGERFVSGPVNCVGNKFSELSRKTNLIWFGF